MLPSDYSATVTGYNNKKNKEAELLRASVWAGKATWEGSIDYRQFCNRFFPLPHDVIEEQGEFTMTQEEAAEVLKRHDKLIKNRKNWQTSRH